ncbi:oligosaccharide flippase family protein [Rheinheimera sp. MMS21-TC3]|uniref:oligosaccharide flippase family protein n=1 Tax=Rheinheimera sp. MMS21-TC3 TaxID=3072790 RepID=UPI0028C38C20|nr:oligosaccharide flippase family protein [Rheinheimera sp. MMS21-TC3]WNO61669.1 oligosaccharide flippase family protein [Rheinheimera sp. MMS21-TC3]
MISVKSRGIWIVLAAISAALHQLILMVIMSRLLSVQEVGLYSLLLVFTALAGVLQDGGLASFIVHKQKLKRAEYSAMFILSTLLGLVIASLLIASSPFLSLLYQQPLLTEYMPLVAITLLINSCVTPYQASMLICQRQIALAKIDIFSKTFATVLTVYLLLSSTLGIASALYGAIAAACIRLLILGYSLPIAYQPSLAVNLSIIPKALKFGSYQTAALVLNQLRTRLDQLVIGKLMGMETLAIYSLAKELISHPNRFIAPLIRNLLFPKLAQHQQKPTQQQHIFSQAIKAIAWSNSIIFATLALAAGPIVQLVYSNDYRAAAPILSLLAAYGIVRNTGAAYVSFAQAQGRAELEFYWNVFASIIMGAVIWFSASTLSLSFTAMALAGVQLSLSYIGFYFFRYHIAPLKQVNYIALSLGPVLVVLSASIIGYIIYA